MNSHASINHHANLPDAGLTEYLRKYLKDKRSSSSLEDREDAVQDAMVELYASVPFEVSDHQEKFRAWLRTIALRSLFDADLKTQRLTTLPSGEHQHFANRGDDIVGPVASLPDALITPPFDQIVADGLTAVELLETLKGRERDITWCYYQGTTRKELAEMLILTPADVRQVIHRAHVHMRKSAGAPLHPKRHRKGH